MKETSANAAQLSLLPLYDNSFLNHHAGKIIEDPEIAIVELVANCWDAGAGRVEIKWPTTVGQEVSVRDDGIGMTKSQLTQRWLTLNYNRINDVGYSVEFPPKARKSGRRAFGRN